MEFEFHPINSPSSSILALHFPLPSFIMHIIKMHIHSCTLLLSFLSKSIQQTVYWPTTVINFWTIYWTLDWIQPSEDGCGCQADEGAHHWAEAQHYLRDQGDLPRKRGWWAKTPGGGQDRATHTGQETQAGYIFWDRHAHHVLSPGR